MFELSEEVDLALPVGAFSNNISGYYHESGLTYVAAAGKHSVGLCQWDSKFDNVKNDQINLLDKADDVYPVIIQVKLVSPNNRGSPIVVITTLKDIQIYTVVDPKRIFIKKHPGLTIKTEMLKEYRDREVCGRNSLEDVVFNVKELHSVARGVTCVDNLILIGCNDGSVMVLHSNNSRKVTEKPSLMEHQNPIIGLATCGYDYLTVCADVAGNVSVWPRSFKTVSKRICTNQSISAVNILRKYFIIGNYQGMIFLYNVRSGELVAEVSAHGREVTNVSVAPESAYMLTVSRDGVVNIWRLHTRRPETFAIEFQQSVEVENRMLTGAVFLNNRGNAFVTGAYDDQRLNVYRTSKRLQDAQCET